MPQLVFSQVPTSSVPHFPVAEVMFLFSFLLLPHPCSLKIAMLLFLFSLTTVTLHKMLFQNKKGQWTKSYQYYCHDNQQKPLQGYNGNSTGS